MNEIINDDDDDIVKFVNGFQKEVEEATRIRSLTDNITLQPLLVVFSLIIKERLGENINGFLNQGMCEEEALMCTRNAISFFADYFKQKITLSIDDYLKAKDEVNG